MLDHTEAAFVLVQTPDCRFEDTVVERALVLASADDRVAAWEFRRKPLDATKPYDPLTFDTPSVAGPALLLNVSAWRRCAGAARSWPALSRRFQAAGYRLRYLPHSVVWCEERLPPFQLGCGWRDRLDHAARIVFGTPAAPDCAQQYASEFRATTGFRFPAAPKEAPLVSLIMRTHAGRRHYLSNALHCVQQQTYPAIELVLLEDGSSEAAGIALDDRTIVYRSLPKAGRVAAGNAGLALARGRYLGFFDDDDLLWPDHVEVLVSALQAADDGVQAAYAYAIESAVDIESLAPLRLRERRHRLVGGDFSPEALRSYNRLPIQAVLFDRSLYEQLGGLDASLGALEDWDLWLRYTAATKFRCAPKITSLYRIPARRKERWRRAAEHSAAETMVRAKHGLQMRR